MPCSLPFYLFAARVFFGPAGSVDTPQSGAMPALQRNTLGYFSG
jgi:hypothetical protein